MLRVRVFGSARTRQVTHLGSINICLRKGQFVLVVFVCGAAVQISQLEARRISAVFLME